NPSDLCNRRISAQSSTEITLPSVKGGQLSPVAWGSVFTRRRQIVQIIETDMRAAIGTVLGNLGLGRVDSGSQI
ncbi:hypothetical protein ACLQ3C_21585, partial [Gordonia sp. DT30]|uniref:hypothetical protein n=1 Tax=Gordonia sp. DT30 TaxID=3416546 RepID=UPI003CE771BC